MLHFFLAAFAIVSGVVGVAVALTGKSVMHELLAFLMVATAFGMAAALRIIDHLKVLATAASAPREAIAVAPPQSIAEPAYVDERPAVAAKPRTGRLFAQRA